MLAHESLDCYINYFKKCLLHSFTLVFQMKRDSGEIKDAVIGLWTLKLSLLCWNDLDSCKNHRSIQFVAVKSCYFLIRRMKQNFTFCF